STVVAPSEVEPHQAHGVDHMRANVFVKPDRRFVCMPDKPVHRCGAGGFADFHESEHQRLADSLATSDGPNEQVVQEYRSAAGICAVVESIKSVCQSLPGAFGDQTLERGTRPKTIATVLLAPEVDARVGIAERL